jgi:DNA-binding CsgD family transcriptional regulator
MALAAAALVLQGRAMPALRIAEAGAPHVGNAVTADPYPDNPAGVFAAAHCLALVLDGRLDEAGALAGATLAPFTSSQVDARLTVTATMAGRVALLRGQLVEARRWGGEALHNAGPGPGSQWPAAVVGTAAAQRGDRADARAALDHAAATTPAIPLIAHELTLARAWAQVADGDLGAARRTAARAAAGAAEAGAAVFELLAWLDLARLGEAATASPRLTELAHVVEGPFAAASAAYARAAAESDGDALDRVAAELEGMGAVLVAAEAAAGAAAAHRRAGSQRRDRASRARAWALAARCPGARTPALHELDADPGLPRLTRREREVAALVARGLTNRQIAQRLHVSIRTVNAHLGHVYAKLGTSDRAQLAVLVPATPA